MKKIIMTTFTIVMICLVTNVNAQTLDRYGGATINLAPKSETESFSVGNSFNSLSNYKDIAEYFEDQTLKYIPNVGHIKMADEYIDLLFSDVDVNFGTYYNEYKKDNFGTTETEVRTNLAKWWKANSDKSNLLYSYVPAELSSPGVTLRGGSNGDRSCPDCSEQSVNMPFLYKQNWYPLILEELISIHKDDANGQKINFNYIDDSGSKYSKYTITDNGNVDADGTYISLNKLKINKSEYEKIMSGEQKLKLYVYEAHSPFAMDYLELLKNDEYKPFYVTKHAYNKEGVEVPLKSPSTAYYKSFETFELDKSYIKDNAIYGLYLMQTGRKGTSNPTNNPVLDDKLLQYNSNGIVYYYRFKIELDIVDDNDNSVTIATKNDRDIKDSNAQIYLEDELINIPNKTSWSEGRIYVQLDVLCKQVKCNYQYDNNTHSYKVNYYPIQDNKDIVYSLSLNEDNNVFESVLKVYDEVYNFKNKIMDASPFNDSGKLYVPIRFLLEGLGAQVDYYPTNGEQPEEVRIYFDPDNFIETSINNEAIQSDNIDISNLSNLKFQQKYNLSNDESFDMNYFQFVFDNNIKDLKICYDDDNNSNCDLKITNNSILTINSNKCFDNLGMYVINKYNDYPYFKYLTLNKECN